MYEDHRSAEKIFDVKNDFVQKKYRLAFSSVSHVKTSCNTSNLGTFAHDKVCNIAQTNNGTTFALN